MNTIEMMASEQLYIPLLRYSVYICSPVVHSLDPIYYENNNDINVYEPNIFPRLLNRRIIVIYFERR